VADQYRPIVKYRIINNWNKVLPDHSRCMWTSKSL